MTGPSTLAAWRVGGQVDRSWLPAAGELRSWTRLRAVALLSPLPVGPVTDPSNDAVAWPTLVGNVVTLEAGGGLWWTEPLKATTGTDPSTHLNPVGLGWQICLEALHTNGVWAPVGDWLVGIDTDRDYTAEGETFSNGAGGLVIDVGYLAEPTLGPGSAGDVVEEVITLSALPEDNADHDLINLIGNPDLPSGLYRFDVPTATWVQV